MWALVAEAARSGHSPDLVSALGDSLSELVALNETRIVAGLYARVPETVVLLLLVGSALSLGMVGYMAGLKRRRSVLSAVVMVVALGVVLTIVIDLDRPAGGPHPGEPAGAPRRPEVGRPAVAVTARTDSPQPKKTRKGR